MKRKAQVILAGAGAGAAAGIYGLTRLLGGKHIKRLTYGYCIKIKKAVTVKAPAGRLYAWKQARSPRQLREAREHTGTRPSTRPRKIRFRQVTRRPGQVRPARRIGLCCCRSAAASLTHHDRPLANGVAV